MVPHTHTDNPSTSNRPFTSLQAIICGLFNLTIHKQSPIPHKIKLPHILQIHAPTTPQKKSHQLQPKLPRVLPKTTASSHLEPMQTAPTRVQQSKQTPRQRPKLKKNSTTAIKRTERFLRGKESRERTRRRRGTKRSNATHVKGTSGVGGWSSAVAPVAGKLWEKGRVVGGEAAEDREEVGWDGQRLYSFTYKVVFLLSRYGPRRCLFDRD